LAQSGQLVTLWARDQTLARQIKEEGRNPRYLSTLKLPDRVRVVWQIDEALAEAEIVVLAVPSHAMRQITKAINPLIKQRMVVLSLAKGIEEGTFCRMSEVVEEELGSRIKTKIAVLSGPNHAEEVAQNIPTATVVACRDIKIAQFLQQIFMTNWFRVYTNSDVIGVELGGATKNVIAIAAGISDGLGFGDNTKASLMTRGLAEMIRLGLVMGARRETFAGLSGVGDLIATCTSRHSRNRAVGERLGKGESLARILKEMRMVAEGVRTTKAVYQMALKYGIEMPITESVYQVLYENKNPRDCVEDLMQRGATSEIK
jgi:glycerol-3-phosphate dehydrogenase (NAD(P)+)